MTLLMLASLSVSTETTPRSTSAATSIRERSTRHRRPAEDLDRLPERSTHGRRIFLALERPAQLHEGEAAEQRRDPERDRVIDQHRRSGHRERLVVQDEDPDEPSVDAAYPTRHRDVSTQLPDQVADHQHADGGRIAECRKAGSEHRNVKPHEPQ